MLSVKIYKNWKYSNINASLNASGNPTEGNTVAIGGLPFASVGNQVCGTIMSSYTVDRGLVGYMDNNKTKFYLYHSGSTSGWNDVKYSEVGQAYFHIQLTYRV